MAEIWKTLTTPVALMEWAINSKPAAVICDIDGTLAPIASTPGAARLAPGARDALVTLTRTVDLVAVVTGRAAADGAAMIGLPDVLVIGNHGFEWLYDGVRTVAPEAEAAIPDIAAALEEIEAATQDEPLLNGVLIENKVLSGSVHYRLTADPGASRDRLLDLATRIADRWHLRLTEGRMVLELRPSVPINKGVAIRDMIDRHALRGAVFLGDDVTDIDGFAMLTKLRSSTGFAGAAIAVSDPEAKPEVIAAADLFVPDVAACVTLLGDLGRRLLNKRAEA